MSSITETEKTQPATETTVAPVSKRTGFFRKRKDANTTVEAVDEKTPADAEEKPQNNVAPVGFREMFRCVFGFPSRSTLWAAQL